MPGTMPLIVATSGDSSGDSAALLVALASLLFAVASFLVAGAALWVTALKRARIGLHRAPANDSWRVGVWSGLMPDGHDDAHVVLAVYVHNSGANAGILESVRVESDGTFDGVLADPIRFYDAKTHPDNHPANFRAQFPMALAAGQIEELFLVGALRPSLGPIQRLRPDEQADIEREEAFALKLFEAAPIRLTVRWSYARPAGLRGRTPETTSLDTVIELSVDGLRDEFVKFWRRRQADNQHYAPRAARLIAIATTGTAPAPEDEQPS